MEGIITACVAFIFVCTIKPELVKNKSQFYVGFGCVLLALLLSGLAGMFNSPSFVRVSVGITALLLLVSIVALYLSAGGLTISDLTSDIKGAYEVIRRGEEEKEVIIPIDKQQMAQPGQTANPKPPEKGPIPFD